LGCTWKGRRGDETAARSVVVRRRRRRRRHRYPMRSVRSVWQTHTVRRGGVVLRRFRGARCRENVAEKINGTAL